MKNFGMNPIFDLEKWLAEVDHDFVASNVKGFEEEQAFIIRSDEPLTTIANISQMDSICGYAVLPGEVLEMEDTFFDTPEGSIRKAKSSLRVRKSTNEEGKTTTLVCMKGGKTSKGSSIRRENEFVWPYESPTPFDMADLFGLEILQRRKTTRITKLLVNPLAKKKKQFKAELALDFVSYIDDDGEAYAKLYEVEIEMKSDISVSLKTLSESLQKRFPELEKWEVSKFGVGNILDIALQIQLDDNGVITADSFDAIYSLVG